MERREPLYYFLLWPELRGDEVLFKSCMALFGSNGFQFLFKIIIPGETEAFKHAFSQRSRFCDCRLGAVFRRPVMLGHDSRVGNDNV
jgi:hypothetical protein